MSFVPRFPGDQPKNESFWLAWIICAFASFGIPALWTMMAHVSYLELHRIEGRVTAASKSCLLFLVPFSVQKLDSVESTSSKVIEGRETELWERKKGSTARTESTGVLTLTGQEGEIELCVAPESLTLQQQKIDAFLADSGATNLNLFLVSTWNGLYFAIPLCLLPILFLLVTIDSLVRFLWKRFR